MATKQILDNLGEDLSTVEESAATVQQYTELRDREVELPPYVDVYGKKVHRFQVVRETMEMPMGDDTTEWVITGWDTEECTVTLKVPTDWSSKTVTFEELEVGDFTPLYYSTGNPDGTNVKKIPLFGY